MSAQDTPADPQPDGLDAATERIRRREMRPARSALSVVVAVILVLLLGYVALEAGTRAVGSDPWLIRPETAWGWFAGLPSTATVPAAVVIVGVLVLLAGLGLIALAVTPGTLRRYPLPTERVVGLVEADVIAQSLLRTAHLAAGVGPDQVRVLVDRSTVTVTVRPTSGVGVDAGAVQREIADELTRQGFGDTFTVNVSVAAHGVVGQ